MTIIASDRRCGQIDASVQNSVEYGRGLRDDAPVKRQFGAKDGAPTSPPRRKADGDTRLL